MLAVTPLLEVRWWVSFSGGGEDNVVPGKYKWAQENIGGPRKI